MRFLLMTSMLFLYLSGNCQNCSINYVFSNLEKKELIICYNDIEEGYNFIDIENGYNFTDIEKGYCSLSKYKVFYENDLSFIKLDKEKIYLYPEQLAEFKGDLCSLFTENFEEPDKLYSHSPNVVLFFITNSAGNIVEKGFLRPDSETYYTDYSYKILEDIENENAFIPAQIDGKPVSSIYTKVILYSNLSCMDRNLGKVWSKK